uniref:WGS project CBMI000000000 data, contig CS3069_c003491 n=1 Tax=Fusarium clavum TaxID=2594811 RepID=A0A090MDT0_9HYPO|nr:unnamed protein product [Fusarium clavum]
MRTLKTIGALAALLQLAVANLDVVTLFAKADAYIQEASATLVLGDVPLSNHGDVALWSAIMMQNEASFLQGVTQNSPEGLGYCSNLGNKWCNFAYALIGKLGGQKRHPCQGNSRIPSQDSLQGRTRRNLLHFHRMCCGHLLYCSGPYFGQTGGWDQGATGGDMSTPDGGKTWEFTTLQIPATDVQH